MPRVGSIIRLTMRRLVVLPQPEGPTSTVILPVGAVSVSSSTATVPSGYCLVTASNRIMRWPLTRSATWLPNLAEHADASADPRPTCTTASDLRQAARRPDAGPRRPAARHRRVVRIRGARRPSTGSRDPPGRGPCGTSRPRRLTLGEHLRAGVARPRLDARPAHARRRHARLGGGDPRRVGRQRRAAHDRARPRRLAGPAAVGRQRLPAGPGLARARGRCARRPVRAAPGLPRRGRLVPGGVRPVRRSPRHRPSSSRCACSRASGRRCSHPARCPSSRRRSARRTAPRRSARGPGCRGWPRPSGPLLGGWLVDHVELAVDLRDQRAAVRRVVVAHRAQRPREPRRRPPPGASTCSARRSRCSPWAPPPTR